jgi:N-acetylglucosaminyl-diphospho-decaprenol L-rhamnosyltransferase
MNNVALDISIVVGKNEKVLFPCLRSVIKEKIYPLSIYLTFNWEMPFIIRNIQNEFPGVHILSNFPPQGFAHNHNNIIKQSCNKYILILNDDTLILGKCIETLVEFMENHPRVAVVGPKLLNPDFSIQHSTYGPPNLIKIGLNLMGIKKYIPYNRLTLKFANIIFPRNSHAFWRHDKIREVETMTGACILVRREAIKEIGLMDEVSLAYGEEQDWNHRMRQKRWKIVFNPEAEIIHYGGQTTREMGALIESERIKGLLNFFKKHRSKVKLKLLQGMIFSAYQVKLATAKLIGVPEKIIIYRQICKSIYRTH